MLTSIRAYRKCKHISSNINILVSDEISINTEDKGGDILKQFILI